MRIQTLKDLKEALKDIPNKVLGKFGIGQLEESHLQLLCDEGDDEIDCQEYWEKTTTKYKLLKDISNYFENITKAQMHIDSDSSGWDDKFVEEYVSSDDRRLKG